MCSKEGSSYHQHIHRCWAAASTVSERSPNGALRPPRTTLLGYVEAVLHDDKKMYKIDQLETELTDH